MIRKVQLCSQSTRYTESDLTLSETVRSLGHTVPDEECLSLRISVSWWPSTRCSLAPNAAQQGPLPASSAMLALCLHDDYRVRRQEMKLDTSSEVVRAFDNHGLEVLPDVQRRLADGDVDLIVTHDAA